MRPEIAGRPATLKSMRSPIRRTGHAAAAFGVLLSGIACTPGDSSSDQLEPVPGVPSGTVAIPPERLTPFCQAMNDLSDRLENDPPSDINGLIVETYTEIADQVPGEIANEFAAVLAGLQGGPLPVPPVDTVDPATPTDATGPGDSLSLEDDELPDEGYLPGDDPAERVNAYVEFTCRDSQNNPGPPATQPFGDIAPPTTDS